MEGYSKYGKIKQNEGKTFIMFIELIRGQLYKIYDITDAIDLCVKKFCIMIFHNSSNALCLHFTVKYWYLSADGHNTDSCGTSTTNSCKTLNWLLGRYYNTSYNINTALILSTDTSLLIDNNILVSLLFII